MLLLWAHKHPFDAQSPTQWTPQASGRLQPQGIEQSLIHQEEPIDPGPVTRRHFLTTTAGLAGGPGKLHPRPARGQQREISYLCWNNFAPTSDKKLAEIGQRFTKDTGIKLKIDHVSHMGPQQSKYASEVRQTQSGPSGSGRPTRGRAPRERRPSFGLAEVHGRELEMRMRRRGGRAVRQAIGARQHGPTRSGRAPYSRILRNDW